MLAQRKYSPSSTQMAVNLQFAVWKLTARQGLRRPASAVLAHYLLRIREPHPAPVD